jgi:hypothetical protein
MGRDDDLRAEIQFHIDSRVEKHINGGMPPDDAEALARRQFGDLEAAMNGMRRARARSVKTAVIALMFFSVVAAGLWFYGSMTSGPSTLPQFPAVPVRARIQKRPPPPPPPPTWEEFVAKVNTFGDGTDAKSRRR